MKGDCVVRLNQSATLSLSLLLALIRSRGRLLGGFVGGVARPAGPDEQRDQAIRAGELHSLQVPNHHRWHAKWKLSWNSYSTHCMHVFCTFGTNLYTQSVLINKISASELSQKFIKRALLVGYTQYAVEYSSTFCGQHLKFGCLFYLI